MADTPRKDLLPTAESPAADDYLLLDGETKGTRRVLAVRPIGQDVCSADFILAASDLKKRLICTTTLTITLPSLGVLGDGFVCEIVNDGPGDVTIKGAASVVLDPDDIAIVMEANGKQRVIRGLSEVLRS